MIVVLKKKKNSIAYLGERIIKMQKHFYKRAFEVYIFHYLASGELQMCHQSSSCFQNDNMGMIDQLHFFNRNHTKRNASIIMKVLKAAHKKSVSQTYERRQVTLKSLFPSPSQHNRYNFIYFTITNVVKQSSLFLSQLLLGYQITNVLVIFSISNSRSTAMLHLLQGRNRVLIQ